MYMMMIIYTRSSLLPSSCQLKWMNAISLIGGGGGRCMFVGTEFEGGRGSVVDTTRRRCVGVCTSCGGKEGCEVIMS